jgi:hypothetical protein
MRNVFPKCKSGYEYVRWGLLALAIVAISGCYRDKSVNVNEVGKAGQPYVSQPSAEQCNIDHSLDNIENRTVEELWKLADYYSFCVGNVRDNSSNLETVLKILHSKGEGRAAYLLGRISIQDPNTIVIQDEYCKRIRLSQYYAREAVRLGDSRGMEIERRLAIIRRQRDYSDRCNNP